MGHNGNIIALLDGITDGHGARAKTLLYTAILTGSQLLIDIVAAMGRHFDECRIKYDQTIDGIVNLFEALPTQRGQYLKRE
jgi:hypothetical protein